MIKINSSISLNYSNRASSWVDPVITGLHLC